VPAGADKPYPLEAVGEPGGGLSQEQLTWDLKVATGSAEGHILDMPHEYVRVISQQGTCSIVWPNRKTEEDYRWKSRTHFIRD